MIENDDLLIRLMNRNDFEVMVKWLNNQRVLEFYEELPSNFDKVEKKYGPRVEGKHYVTPCIVEYNNQPLGYIQYYEIQEDGLKKYDFTSNQNIYGIDQFIGETTLWDKGIGTSMILMMINHLRSKGASKIVLEVKKDNIRAIKSYKKCGFKKTKEITNELNLMEYNMNGVLH
ncbi:GNAT family N-acetyltransferase [Planococcus sp. S3-L1]|uniref:GNAT family N-acetyltransferase n=1 Tax=Planococcus sp. S3-L1 TaxID=3046200 RepID=UPI0024BADBD4|nr:GNAT family N-acetyltransferase [Planococcus sp. S3-L1]MDJ0333549.1 GNAT family N-acetyltransferase [Planococcus sp. S3-L1]